MQLLQIHTGLRGLALALLATIRRIGCLVSRSVLFDLVPALVVAAACLALPARAELAVPSLTGPVVDLTGTLSADQQAVLSQQLTALSQTKGAQIAVLMVTTTDGEDIAQFGIRVAEAWKIGREKIDDGVILIVAKDDHKLRIEVGRGLEGAITDVYSKRIIAEQIAPAFKAGDYNAGITRGVAALTLLINGEALPAPTQKTSKKHKPPAWFILLFGAFFLLLRFGRRSDRYSSVGLLAGLGGFSSGSSSGDSGGFSGGGGDFGGGGASGDW